MDDTKFLLDLQTRYRQGEKFKFVFFWGHESSKDEVSAACFSQWYNAPFSVDGERFLTAEHFMMAEKATLFGDLETRARILLAPNPGAVKALGRQIRDFDEATWKASRFAIVVRANAAKFGQNPALGTFLRETKSRVLVEASPVDRIWGIGLARDDRKAENPELWDGLNLLGFALMEVREGL